jgi:hypothetical protein
MFWCNRAIFRGTSFDKTIKGTISEIIFTCLSIKAALAVDILWSVNNF